MTASDTARDPAARLAEAPEPPAHLSPRAAAEWRLLAPAAAALGTLAGADLRAFELLAETLATEAAARAVVEAEGCAVPTAGGGAKPRPEVRVMETARMQAAGTRCFLDPACLDGWPRPDRHEPRQWRPRSRQRGSGRHRCG